MRKHCLLLLIFAAALPCLGQTRPATSWERVQTLPMGTHIKVKATSHSTTCLLSAVDADGLTCKHGNAKPDSKFLRTEIRQVIRPRGGRSAMIGLAVGGGGAAIIGAAATPSDSFGGGKPGGAIIWGVLVGVPATIVCGLTDFMHTTIYRAP